MTHPLDGAQDRLRRARQHFEVLESEFGSISPYTKPIRLGSKFEPDLQKIFITITEVPPLNPTWPFIVSECLFNLRCALDYLAWQLAIWNLQRKGHDREPVGSTQNPIATTKERFQNRQVEDIHPDHVALIKDLQPYGPHHMRQYTDALAKGLHPELLAETHVLARLARLNNHDKHRLLRPTIVAASSRTVGPFDAVDCDVAAPNFHLFGEPGFEVGAVWAEFDVVRVTGGNPRVHMPVDIEPSLAFGGNSPRSFL